MKLQEVAFMISLINANYHRRMLYFWGNVLVIIIPLPLIIIFRYYGFGNNDLNTLCIILLFSFLVGGLVLMFLKYVMDASKLPWSIKKDQMTSLRQQAEAKGDFEDLQYHVPLHEYFEMY